MQVDPYNGHKVFAVVRFPVNLD